MPLDGKYHFTVEPTADGKWYWSTWESGTTASSLHDCDSKEAGIQACNEIWREILEPYVEMTRDEMADHE